MKLSVLIAVGLAAIGVWFLLSRRPQPQVKGRREMNEHAFAGMRAKTKWNLESDMLWGFFFTNPTQEPLVPVGRALEKAGYRLVDIYQDDQKINWWLHVEKIEVHSVDSLTQREYELVAVAEKAGLGSFDGWDVGPVAKEDGANQALQPNAGAAPSADEALPPRG
jgi:hypothetical protein